MAVLSKPIVRLKSALTPLAVLRSAEQPTGSGVTARAVGERAKQATASGMSRSASRTGDRFTECFNGRVVVFICAEDCKSLGLLSSTLLKALLTPASVF